MTEGQQTMTVEQALELADAHYREERLPEAENVYQQVLKKYPDHHVALHMLGLIAHKVGKNEIALQLITKAVTIKSDYFDAQNNLGIVQQSLGNNSEAISSFQKAVSVNPNHFHALNNLGLVYYNQGNVDDALDSYDRALVAHSEHTDSYINRGVALQSLGKLEEAADDYLTAISIEPENVKPYINLAGVLRNLGKLQEAVANYQTVIKLQPTHAGAHNDLGNTLRDLGDLTSAIASYQKASDILPDFGMAYYNQGSVLKELGQLDEAIQCLEKAGTELSRAVILECLYALGDKERFTDRLQIIMVEDKTNVGVAAISAFASHQLRFADPYPFCNNPLDFISITNVSTQAETSKTLLKDVEKQIGQLKLGGGNQSLLESGFQSKGNLFSHKNEVLTQLEEIIKLEISSYVSERENDDCLFIKSWPDQYTLNGWYILMKQGGHLKWHNHISGWLSGALYLKMPTPSVDEGYIQFRLQGDDLPIFTKDFPEETRQVIEGDLVLFPSSLFHRTVPFQTNEERLCIAFDLIPS